ncbi:MAG: amidohydrolase [Lachnospiraceae bacterium]|nr:amidohydrolase [Lachnospiraceae bacterium]
MNTRFYNARVLTMNKSTSVIDDGEVLVKGGSIAYAGDSAGAKKAARGLKFDREIDANGNLVMPGFKDAHTHSAMTFLRTDADDLPLDRWLNDSVFPREAKLTGEDIYHCTKLAVLEYLTSGITTIGEMYMHPYDISRATEEMGMRMVLCGGMNNFSQSIEEQEEWFNNLNNKDSLTSYRLGLHAEYTSSKELIGALSDLAHKLEAPVYLHNSETKGEVEGCRERYNATPTEFMDSLGLFDYGGTSYHCVYLTENDMDIIKKRNISVVTNPASNLKLASGIAPIKAIADKGINIGIGTDGPASNNCLDMFREMFLTTALSKLKEEDASVMDANKVLEMAIGGGARAMGLDDVDCLAEGKRADLIMIDLHQPNMRPFNNITKNLAYSGSKSNVKLTMINGEILYEDGKFTEKYYVDEIYEEVQKVIERVR